MVYLLMLPASLEVSKKAREVALSKAFWSCHATLFDSYPGNFKGHGNQPIGRRSHLASFIPHPGSITNHTSGSCDSNLSAYALKVSLYRLPPSKTGSSEVRTEGWYLCLLHAASHSCAQSWDNRLHDFVSFLESPLLSHPQPLLLSPKLALGARGCENSTLLTLLTLLPSWPRKISFRSSFGPNP